LDDKAVDFIYQANERKMTGRVTRAGGAASYAAASVDNSKILGRAFG